MAGVTHPFVFTPFHHFCAHKFREANGFQCPCSLESTQVALVSYINIVTDYMVGAAAAGGVG